MSAQALALVMAGACLHALWNLLAKKASGGLPFVWLYGAVSVLAMLPFGIADWVGMRQPLAQPVWIAIVASALVHIVYSLTLQRGYRVSDFSIVYPVARGSGPLFAVLGAIMLLSEMPSIAGWAGIALILCGILLISGSARIASASDKVRAGLIWGGITGLTIASYTVIDGWAMKAAGVTPVLYYGLSLALRTLILAPFALRDRNALRAQWTKNGRHVIGVGLMSPLAYLLVLTAMQSAPVSYVAPVRELSMLLAVIFGARLLREAMTPARVAGAGCMVLGVILLAWAP